MGKTRVEVKSLFYITHRDNLPSILRAGILSHLLVQQRGLESVSIYDEDIVRSKKDRILPDGRSLWSFANVYFQARNPMLYRVLHEWDASEIAVVGVKPSVLSMPGAYIALGNAASRITPILPAAEGRRELVRIWPIIQSEYWDARDGSKRTIMAECLVPDHIPPEAIHSVFVANHEEAEEFKRLVPPRVAVVPEPAMFFRPSRRLAIAERLYLFDGDMFFSPMQTLTVSVNLVGIMGKGLAARAKYQFPDVYVRYQDACRQGKIGMGRPFLYKREVSVDEELADLPDTLADVNAAKWFLLFPTKRHWREKSDLAAIQQGLEWIKANYAAEGIQSLALPALGCGLGRLDWRDVGPVMCRALSHLDIEVGIYLPREHRIPECYLTPEHLLGSRDDREN